MKKLFILTLLVVLASFASAAFNVNVSYLGNQTYEVRSNITNALRGTITIANPVVNGAFSTCDLFTCEVQYNILSRQNVTYNENVNQFFRHYFLKGRNNAPDAKIERMEKLVNVSYNIPDQTRVCTGRELINGIWVSTNCTINTVWRNFTQEEWVNWREDGQINEGMNVYRVVYSRSHPLDYYDLFPSIMDSRNLTEFAWWNNTFSYKIPIVINSGQSSTLSNFVARVQINTSGLISAGKMNNSCYDLRPVNESEDSLLSYEIEDCNHQNTTVYFRIPSLGSGNHTYYIYYGALGVIGQENWTDVWRPAGWVGAFLGKTNGTNFMGGTILIDSAGYNNVTTNANSSCFASLGVGRYGFGIRTDGRVNCYFEKVNPLNLAAGNSSSTEYWDGYFIAQGGTDTSDNAIWSYGTTSGPVGAARSASYLISTPNFVKGVWYGDTWTGGTTPTTSWNTNWMRYTNSSNQRQHYNVTTILNNTYGNAQTKLSTLRIGEIAWADVNEGSYGNIDELLISNRSIATDWLYGFEKQVFYTGAEVPIPSSAPTVTIFYPINNTDNLNVSITGLFDFESASFASATCTVRLNGTSAYVGTIANATNTTFTLSNLGHAQAYNITADCVNSTSTGYSSTFFVDRHFYNTSSGLSVQRDAAFDNFTFNVTFASQIDNVNVTLTYGGVPYTFSAKTLSAPFANFTYQFIAPHVTTNATEIVYNFTINATYSNTTSLQYTPWNTSQMLIFSAYPILTIYNASAFLGTTQGFYLLSSLIDGAVAVNSTLFYNSTAFSSTSSLQTTTAWHNSTITAFPVQTNSFLWQVSFLNGSGAYITYNFSGFTQTVSTASIFECNATDNTRVLVYYMLDEENQQNVSGTLQLDLNYSGSSDMRNPTAFTLIKNNTNTMAICISSNSTIYVDTTLHYYNGTTYPSRYHYFLRQELSNATFYQNILTSTTDLIKLTELNFISENGVGLSNKTIRLERSYTGNNTYLLVSMAKTDLNGDAVTYLRPNDVYHRATVLNPDGTIYAVLEPFILECSPTASSCSKQFNILATAGGFLWEYIGNIAVGCTFYNATELLQCVVNDGSGTIQSANLTIYKASQFNHTTQYCSDQVSGTSVTLNCFVNSTHGNLYSYIIYATFSDGSTTLLKLGTLEFTPENIFGYFGVFIVILLVTAVGLASSFHPSALIVANMAIIVVSSMIGLIAVPATALGGLLLVGFTLAFLMR